MSDAGNSAARQVTGIVAQDKSAGSREILVHPQDVLPYTTGKLSPKAQKVDVNLSDTHQGGAAGSVTETNVVRAIWKGDSNTDQPPDVVKGEIVELTQDGNTGTLYWSASGRTTTSRSRERKEMRAANQEGYSKNLDDGNSYFIAIDTLTKKEIRLQTCMSDGEKFGYTILINPKDSMIQICDNENNEISIDSQNQHIIIRNKDESFIDMMKKNIVIGCHEAITLKAEKQVVIDTPNLTHSNSGGDGCTVINTKALQINAEKNINLKSPNGVGLHGPVEAETIVSGGIQSQYFSSGTY